MFRVIGREIGSWQRRRGSRRNSRIGRPRCPPPCVSATRTERTLVSHLREEPLLSNLHAQCIAWESIARQPCIPEYEIARSVFASGQYTSASRPSQNSNLVSLFSSVPALTAKPQPMSANDSLTQNFDESGSQREAFSRTVHSCSIHLENLSEQGCHGPST